ncbi:MAG: magnesium transporter [Actinobacteria bacterium]|nr:magnesium transporter [Actinomycetota bacterium]
MTSAPVYVSRLVRLPLIDADGMPLGRIDDAVLAPSGADPARVLGFVAAVQRRHIFVNAGRVAEIEPTGVRLRSGTIDVRAFRKRAGEVLVMRELSGRRVQDAFLTDVALERDPDRAAWFATTVALGGRGPLRRRRTHTVPWADVASLFDAGPVYAEVAELREMHAADVADRVRRLPLARRRQLAEAMEDERLADLLEELPEDEQIRIIEGLDAERVAHVLEEMEPDDAADLLGELPEEERQRLLAAMDEEESAGLRRLLSYGEDTAGGLMTPEPVVLPHTATVAEALAVIRQSELPSELAAQVFVTLPPTSTPTGRYLGAVPFQRLLREAPGTALEHCTFDEPEAVRPDLPLRQVAERLAAYDSLAVPVCDEAGRLIGAVTVDDVLDQVLPADWRQRVRR